MPRRTCLSGKSAHTWVSGLEPAWAVTATAGMVCVQLGEGEPPVSTNVPNEEKPQPAVDLVAEFAELGKKLRTTVKTAWASQERQKAQGEIRDGLLKLREELDRAVSSLGDSEPGQSVETEAGRVRDDAEAGTVMDDVRVGIVVGLRGVGAALDKLAGRFTPPEESAKSETPGKAPDD